MESRLGLSKLRLLLVLAGVFLVLPVAGAVDHQRRASATFTSLPIEGASPVRPEPLLKAPDARLLAQIDLSVTAGGTAVFSDASLGEKTSTAVGAGPFEYTSLEQHATRVLPKPGLFSGVLSTFLLGVFFFLRRST